MDDHVLDVFALTEKMHQIKYNEREQWKNNRQQVLAKNQSSKQLSVVGIGHSMGGAILIATILHSRALHRYHGFSKLVLLSPAAYHKYIAPPAKYVYLLDCIIRIAIWTTLVLMGNLSAELLSSSATGYFDLVPMVHSLCDHRTWNLRLQNCFRCVLSKCLSSSTKIRQEGCIFVFVSSKPIFYPCHLSFAGS